MTKSDDTVAYVEYSLPFPIKWIMPPSIQPPGVDLSLLRSSAVAVGAFNIHIVQPNWLVKMGILEEQNLAAEFDAEQPGLRFHSEKQPDMKWLVRPEKLAIECFNASGDPAAFVARVLEKLPHTPLVAIGINFVFGGGRRDIEEDAGTWFPVGLSASRLQRNAEDLARWPSGKSARWHSSQFTICRCRFWYGIVCELPFRCERAKCIGRSGVFAEVRFSSD